LNKKDSFVLGLLDSGPICVAFLFLGLSFGAISNTAHVSLIKTIVISLFVYAMPLQVILVDMIEHGGTILAVLITTIVVNFRFSLMTAALLPYFKKAKTGFVLIATSMLSASSFTVTHVKLDSPLQIKNLDNFFYYLGVSGAGFFVSIIFTLLGFFISGIERSLFIINLLTMILPIHFTALTAMRWPKIKFIYATFLGFILMPFGKLLSNEYALILTPILVGFIFMMLHKNEEKK